MDTKKLILAIALSIIVITVYQYFFMPKPKPVPKPAPQAQERVDPGKDAGTTGDVTAAGTQEDKKGDTKSSSRDLAGLFSKKKTGTTEEKLLEPVAEDLKEIVSKEVVVDTDLFTAVFTNEGAALKSFILKKYLDDKREPLDLVSTKVEKFNVYPFHFSPFEGNEVLLDLNSQKFVYEGSSVSMTLTGGESKELVFKYRDMEKNVSAVKKFVIYNGTYIVGLQSELIKDGKQIDAPYVFGPDLENNVSPQRAIQMGLKIRAFDGVDDKDIEFMRVKTEPTQSDTIEKAEGTLGGNFLWAAYERAYFATVFKTSRRNSFVRYTVVKEKPAIAETTEAVNAAGDTGEEESEPPKPELYSYIVVTNPHAVYMGPKDEDLLDAVKSSFPEVDRIIEYGFLGSVAKILLKGINLVHGFVPNYGWAIVVFTIFLKILLFPLTYTSSVSMAKMQTLQPKIKSIKKKYKNMRDPEQRKKMNQETMALYKKEKVNPASGCLPMLLQMPILFAFFTLLRTCINVRHEPWIIWIKDLSLKDPIYLLPILMGLSQIVVQKMSPTTAEGMQKKMMYLMPLVFMFIVINLPSGLTLYWTASNVLQVGQQWIINKKIFSKKKEEEQERKVQKRKKGAKSK
ncbi:MAG: membrane protein insertase YidC [bacterium]|nr:membrane protein insertase YidC [bacterium]